ncbi:30S ribosomal protein S17e [Candidatus Woesearchaeota archaeon]|jgi:small subunit ribosomal protein S17e|nr:30S ribosomal protein S17e [Candidatus Woesearchaeota archaeon]MBT5740229.1 30S ribosomal protein S17e [Candidatus Woesearchaeota archaeon]
MGRIKTTFIKRKTKELHKMHGDNFTTDFTENKAIVGKYTEIHSKKLRNVVAGYMTRLKKQNN